MSGYTRSFQEKIEFDGDIITVKLTRLTRKAMMEILPFLDIDDQGGVTMTPDQALRFIGESADIVKPFIKEVEGLMVEGETVCPSRNPAVFDEIYEAAYFSPLWTQVAIALIKSSSLAGEAPDTEKKLELPSNAPSEVVEPMTASQPEASDQEPG